MCRGHTRHTFVAVPVALASLLVAGCGSQHDHAAQHTEPPMPWFATQTTVANADGVETDAFWLGEDVVATITVRNVTDATRILHFDELPFLEYDVRRADGTLAWRWSDGTGIAPAHVDVEFAPHEAHSWYAIWHQRTTAGWGVPPGTYDIDAYVPALVDSAIIAHDAPHAVTIVAPPHG